MNIGKRIKELRESIGATQEDIGKRIGVTKATVNRYETGEIDIKRTVAIKLSEIFNVSPAYIMGWTNKPNVNNSNNHGVIGDVADSKVTINSGHGQYQHELSTLEQDILRIYNSVGGKTQMEIMNFIYNIEEREKGGK